MRPAQAAHSNTVRCAYSKFSASICPPLALFPLPLPATSPKPSNYKPLSLVPASLPCRSGCCSPGLPVLLSQGAAAPLSLSGPWWDSERPDSPTATPAPTLTRAAFQRKELLWRAYEAVPPDKVRPGAVTRRVIESAAW